MDEALLPETEVNPERRNDWKEVNNYIVAINNAILELEHLPISSRLIRNIHRLLLDSVRGEHKLPGEFRRSQNWIGGAANDLVKLMQNDKIVKETTGHNRNRMFVFDAYLSLFDSK